MTCFGLFNRNSQSIDQITETGPINLNSPPPDYKMEMLNPISIPRQKLLKLRTLMNDRKLNFYVIPSTDSHGSEYVSKSDKRREFISGFSGSTGTAIHAWLFTDSRYWIQAEEEIDESCWQLMKVGTEGVSDWNYWLGSEDVARTSRIGIDPMLISHTASESLKKSLMKRESTLIYPIDNLIDLVWGSDRPKPPRQPIFLHPIKYAGQSAQEKLANLRKHIGERVAAGYLISSLSELCWLINIRGSDVPYMPFPFGYIYVGSITSGEPSVLFIHPKQVGKEERENLSLLGLEIMDYDHIGSFLSSRTGTVIVDTTLATGLVDKISKYETAENPSLITNWKAIKNEAELEGFRQAYLRDGVAWCRWAAWLEAKMKAGAMINEWTAAIEFDRIRARDPMFISLAYANISATNVNAALPHYEPTEKNSRMIDKETMYLNDSGAHYLDGTTDTTRTVFFGSEPTRDQKLAYTVVLQGHLAVARAVFPGGGDVATMTVTHTTGSQLDVLARQPGWRHGLLYGHGTGHSVGSLSSVHEGPHGIGTSNRAVDIPLRIGHTFTVEPGHYDFDKVIGVRIESFFGVKEHICNSGMKGTQWLSLERFTQVPISKALIDWDLLNQVEREWIESHNEECKLKLMNVLNPECEEDRLAINWLMRQ
ncbi:hypothetical protein CROQUDRAFT_131016 [Cronartium quercuum f. sp. fusiforme G11]|uniref:Xaa-Pro aminopeptidase n=1 Tax=Cronartium quercuum f. sp. fusiforme G11 TaxID=708437 RepID=A0A9P6NMF4_9BASI|nr:hypothetical protein CROQUDRAFT_131016 [Cronartium quercuum f. sp. fusiforme G11]